MDIHWLEQNLCDVPPGDLWLNTAERAQLEWLHIPKRRADWRLGRWTAKCAVAFFLKLPCLPEALAGIELRAAPSGAPEVFLLGQPARLVLSLSHSHGAGLCAIAPAGAELGCDLEAVEPRNPAFLSDYFTDEEQRLVAQTPPTRRDQVLTLLWSAKESALKALRCGLRADTRSVTAAPADILSTRSDEWRPVSATLMNGQTFRGWWRESRGLVWTVLSNPAPLHLVDLWAHAALTDITRY